MAYEDRTYPILVDIESTRRHVMGAETIHRGQKVMYEDDDSNDAVIIKAVTGDASDKFAGIATQTVYNTGNAQGAAGSVYIEFCDKGTFIAELDTAPSVNDMWNYVYADGDSEKVSLTEGTGFMVGVLAAYKNVSDPLGRTNACKVQFGYTVDPSTGA